jgi:hypothetical protein
LKACFTRSSAVELPLTAPIGVDRQRSMPDPNQTVNADSLSVGNADYADSELTRGTPLKTLVKIKSARMVNSQQQPTECGKQGQGHHAHGS